jgi:hypothetical protein
MEECKLICKFLNDFFKIYFFKGLDILNRLFFLDFLTSFCKQEVIAKDYPLDLRIPCFFLHTSQLNQLLR